MKKSTRHLSHDSGLIEGSRGAVFGEKTAKNNANQARLPWKRKINKTETLESPSNQAIVRARILKQVKKKPRSRK